MFWDIFGAMISGCFSILNIPINLGGFSITLWMALLASCVIAIIARLIWGVLE